MSSSTKTEHIFKLSDRSILTFDSHLQQFCFKSTINKLSVHLTLNQTKFLCLLLFKFKIELPFFKCIPNESYTYNTLSENVVTSNKTTKTKLVLEICHKTLYLWLTNFDKKDKLILKPIEIAIDINVLDLIYFIHQTSPNKLIEFPKKILNFCTKKTFYFFSTLFSNHETFEGTTPSFSTRKKKQLCKI